MGGAADSKATVTVARRSGARWIVLDGYGFSKTYLEILQGSGVPILVIDDLGKLSRYACAIVVNQNLHADTALYPDVGRSTQLLLGTSYMMLRREFWRYRDARRAARTGNPRVLVSMGGSDPGDHASHVIDSLEWLGGRDPEAGVLAGAPHPRPPEARPAAAGSKPGRTRA